MRQISISFLFIFTLLSCSDDATVTKSEKALQHVQCMRLVIFPPNRFLETIMNALYDFNESCDYRLEVSQKSGIVCNSNYNADKKALSSFPSGFIRLDLYKDKENIYSYYKDLTHKATQADIQKAFYNLQESIKN